MRKGKRKRKRKGKRNGAGAWGGEREGPRYLGLRFGKSSTHGYQAHTGLETKGIHLPLLLAVYQVVIILHAHELGPAVLLGAELHAGELVGPHAAGADVADLVTAHEIVQRLHGLLDGDRAVETVNLQQIDVIRLEAGEGGVHSLENALPREPAVVDVVDGLVDVLEGQSGRFVVFAHGAAAFGADDEFVARDAVLLDGFGDYAFRIAVAVDVGGVPCVHAAVEGGFE